jgi:cardiolipin synthase (CMP-forming)
MTDTAAKPTGLTLATKITLVRFMGIPFFVLLLVYYTMGLAKGVENDVQRIAALLLFVFVAATDALDGYIARSRGQITKLGRVLDPLADKTLLLSGLILLTRPSLPDLEPHIPIWFTTLVISRDAVLIGGFFLIHHFAHAVEVRPRWTGKLATVLQMATIVWVLLQAKERYFIGIVATAGVFTAVSFAQYVVDGARQLGRIAHH